MPVKLLIHKPVEYSLIVHLKKQDLLITLSLNYLKFDFNLENTQHMIRYFVYSFFLLFLISSCNEESDACRQAPDVSQIETGLEFEDLITPIMNAQSPDELWELMKNNALYARIFLSADQYATNDIAKEQLWAIFNHTAFRDTLYAELKAAFGDFSELKAEFELAFQYYLHYFPEANVPKIRVVLSALQQDMFVSDSLIMIGLDYFVGHKATFRANEIPAYILRRYEPNYVVPITFLMISQKHNVTDFHNQGLLSDMIYYGKSYEFMKSTNPCVADSVLIGYTADEMGGIYRNADIIWANFLENDVLYETSHLMKTKFVGERPKTYEIGEKCPGRIGQWVGWEIVRQYRDKYPAVSLSELMSNTDAEDLFQKSKYKPMVKKK